jgi:ribonuclease Z
MGCVLTFPGGERLAFSGDQIPDGAFAAAVGRCNVLIHEATYEEAMLETAAARGHSTIAGALEIGARMRAEFVFLTHFSSRLETESFILDAENALSAFDHFSAEYEDMAEAIRMGKEVLRTLAG